MGDSAPIPEMEAGGDHKQYKDTLRSFLFT